MQGELHTVPASGALLAVANEGIYFARGTTVPTDGATGYAQGCLFVDTDAAAGSILFCNEGDKDSCDFDAVTVA